MPRPDEIASFLKFANWQDSKVQEIMSGATPRRFSRLTRQNGDTAILMDADTNQKTDVFVALADILRGLELPAPQVLAADVAHGLLLVEDFGSVNLGAVLDAGADAKPHDETIARLLAQLHDNFTPDTVSGLSMPAFNAHSFSEQALLFADHYFPKVKGRPVTAGEKDGLRQAWLQVLSPIDELPRSLLLRDFFADNVMVLDRPLYGYGLGVIDFQEAALGPIAYNLASWCDGARRGADFDRLEKLVETYADLREDLDAGDLLEAAQSLAAQRMTRLIGVAAKQNSDQELSLPLITLQTLLVRHKPLAPVREWLEACGIGD